MKYYKIIEEGRFFKVVESEDVELKISSSSDAESWLYIEDTVDEEMCISIPKSKEGIDATIKLLEEAKKYFFKTQ